MVDGFKSLADVQCNRGSAARGFSVIESCSNTVGGGKKGSNCGMARAKAMLRLRRGKGCHKGREDESLQDL